MINRELLKQTIIENVTICYDNIQSQLVQIGINHKTEGEIRYAAGELVEDILKSIFDTINQFLNHDKISSKVGGSDYLTKRILYKGVEHVNHNIQVDRHVWYKAKRIAFIENKTYLDTCYYDRALADFKKICQALCQKNENPNDCLFIVFAGQKAGSDNKFLNYEAEFWYETKEIMDTTDGIVPKTIYFLKGIRNSSKPLYKIKHALDFDNIIIFANMIVDKIESM